MTEQLISIREAAKAGIWRVRQKQWINPLDHLLIDIMRDGTPGPWTHLYSPINRAISGRDPVSILATVVSYNAQEWLPYTGPVWESQEYQDAAENALRAFDKVLA
jgi:hypothetical protein